MLELNDIKHGVGFFREFVEWVQSIRNREKNKYLKAINAINVAANKTNAYLRDIKEGKDKDREKEEGLSMLWYEATTAIQPINPDCFLSVMYI